MANLRDSKINIPYNLGKISRIFSAEQKFDPQSGWKNIIRVSDSIRITDSVRVLDWRIE